jgi:steroid delta-isomerase-like uncharacterized protein
MSSTKTEDLARKFIQAWNAGHLQVVDELAADNLTVSYTHFPEPFQGPEEFKEMLSQTHQYFPDLTIEIDEIVADGEQAVVHWKYQGTFQKGEMFGVEASGQAVQVAGMTRYQIADGKIQREQGIVDNFGLMMQLGAMPGSG